jgi:hypothetical protein
MRLKNSGTTALLKRNVLGKKVGLLSMYRWYPLVATAYIVLGTHENIQ